MNEKQKRVVKITNSEYRKIKRGVVKYEETNFATIALAPCAGQEGWCEIGDHSALIYYYKVCRPLGVTVNFDKDMTDYYCEFRYGKIKTRGFDTVRKRLNAVKLYQREITKDGRIIFVLSQKFSKEEIDEMWALEQARRDEIGRVLKVDFSDPVLHSLLMHTATRLHSLCFRRLDKLSSSTNGQRMVSLMDAMLYKYYEMSRTKKASRKEDWEELKNLVQKLMIELQIVSELGLWTRQKCMDIGKEIIKIDERIDHNGAKESKSNR